MLVLKINIQDTHIQGLASHFQQRLLHALLQSEHVLQQSFEIHFETHFASFELPLFPVELGQEQDLVHTGDW